MLVQAMFQTFHRIEIHAFGLGIYLTASVYLPWNNINGTVLWSSIHTHTDIGGRYRGFTKTMVLKPNVDLHLLKFLYTAHPWLKPLLAKRWVTESEHLYQTETEEFSDTEE